ncbi:hypothetical protein SGGMMB4_05917 (plasmid) [Sodalis glossinidius str. 'morsitans']|uniref:Uncharacterized protein n=2 Tax=Sodalis glossinidius TaxID=63612 RepID=A0A193QPS0_SODGM|nr:hypothetical protein pSG4.06 [Sodalis glossinidius]CAI59435.2 hypothetical protein pSG4.06 [Sodalis glossinidius]CRL46945.1 hypothetical protein SGGMMB4_05917 [Sodalis glossinidius str. 'morsitans']
MFSDNNRARWVLETPLTLNGLGSVRPRLHSKTPGTFLLPAHAPLRMDTVIVGVDKVESIAPATEGREEETDSQLLTRFMHSHAINNHDDREGIHAALLAVADVQQAAVLENDQCPTISDTIRYLLGHQAVVINNHDMSMNTVVPEKMLTPLRLYAVHHLDILVRPVWVQYQLIMIQGERPFGWPRDPMAFRRMVAMRWIVFWHAGHLWRRQWWSDWQRVAKGGEPANSPSQSGHTLSNSAFSMRQNSDSNEASAESRIRQTVSKSSCLSGVMPCSAQSASKATSRSLPSLVRRFTDGAQAYSVAKRSGSRMAACNAVPSTRAGLSSDLRRAFRYQYSAAMLPRWTSWIWVLEYPSAEWLSPLSRPHSTSEPPADLALSASTVQTVCRLPQSR